MLGAVLYRCYCSDYSNNDAITVRVLKGFFNYLHDGQIERKKQAKAFFQLEWVESGKAPLGWSALS